MRHVFNRWSRGLAGALLLTAWPAALGGGAAPEPEAIRAIRALYADVNAALERGHVEGEHLCDAGRAWRRVRSVEEAAKEDCWPIATVFRLDGAVRKVVLDEATESGDWEARIELYFDARGGVAFRFARLVTFHGGVPGDEASPAGPYVLETRTYYDAGGRQVRELERAFLETTGKDISPRFIEHPELPRYRSVRELPFLKDVRPKR